MAQQAVVEMESERLRNALLAAISHDVRTPLTALIGLAESLRQSQPAATEAQADTAQALADQARELNALVSNLLDMARLQSGAVNLRMEWQSIEEVVGSAIRAAQPALAGKPVQTELPADLPLVEFDAVLIERVLVNLLENAAKYGGAAHRHCRAQADGRCLGADGARPRARPAGRAQGARAGAVRQVHPWRGRVRHARRRPGPGHLQGGGRCPSRRDQRRQRGGRRCRIHDPPAAQAAPSRCSNNTPIAVVIEDEPQIRRFVRGALEAEGWQVHEADTVQRGLIEAGTRKPDLLMLDLGLPDGDGIQLIRDVRAWSGVPIIVLSARVDETDKIAALDAGADDYLTKPFGMGELLARVRANLRRPRAARRTARLRGRSGVSFRQCGGGPSLRGWYGGTARRSISRRSNTGCSRCLSPTRGEC